MKNLSFPKEVIEVLEKLTAKAFEAFVVGGSVRDIILKKTPNDWDITTNAKPDEIREIFLDSFYNNEFGTVTVKFSSPSVLSTKTIEITTYRIESSYKDSRRPDSVEFTKDLVEDLARRDFTINAMAIDLNGQIIDPYKGKEDLDNKIIRTVNEPLDRFKEDALRMMRAVRFAVEMDFTIEVETFDAIKENHENIKKISIERVRDEFVKIIKSDHPQIGIHYLERSGLLKYIIPELLEGVGVRQNKNHIFTVYEHSVRSLSTAAEKGFNLEVRLAALLHDIAKPKTKEGSGYNATFHNHEVFGGRLARKILTRLKFSKEVINKVTKLVSNHMFYYELDKTTDAGIRRMVRRIGPDNIKDQINLRISDRLGMGRPKAVPYRLKLLIKKFEEVQKDPITVKMLKIDGNDLMKLLDLDPGKKLGLILNALLNEVLNDPSLNTKEILEEKAIEFDKLPDEKLKKMSPDIQEFEQKRKSDSGYEKALGLDQKIKI